jgi:hypothetical protein
MEAIHPLTGKKIRVMKTQTHLYRNKKTLIWLRAPPEAYSNPQRYNRWYTLTTTAELAEQWHQTLGTYPSAIILETPTQHTLEWLQTKAPKTRELLFLSKAVMSNYGKDRFTSEGFVNVVCLEELGGMFPHVLRTYVQGDPQAITTSMIAAVFRVHLFHGLTPQEFSNADAQTYLTTLQTTYTFKATDTPLAAPESLWLIQQFFVPTKAKRAKEINHALKKNLESSVIDTVLLLNEEDYIATNKLQSHAKLQQIVTGRRLSYADVILTIQDIVPPNTNVVFCNSDIYLDTPSWQDLWSVDLKDTFLSLLRYELPQDPTQEPQLFGPREDSQDTWVVDSNSVKARKGNWDFEALNFPFGKAGCDNAINIEMLRKKFVVANPALSLKTIHCHTSQLRTYDQDDVVEKPMFLYLDPTGLHDLQPLQTLTPIKQFAYSGALPRKLNANDPKDLKTYCKATHYEANSPNLYDPPTQSVYQFTNSFVTPNGLVYGYDKLVLGKNPTVREAWTTTTISHMTPAIGVQSILAVPLESHVTQNLWQYTTSYLSKILHLRANGYKGDMWMPPSLPRLQELLQHFAWEESVLPVLPHDQDIVGFGQQVTYMEPHDSQLTQEDVEALRAKLKQYEPNPIFPRRVVLFQDDVVLTGDDSLLLETALEEAGFEVNIVYPSRSSPSFLLQRTLGCAFAIATPQTHNLFWLLPKGAKVLDLIPETSIQDTAAHTAGASGLEYWLALVKGGQQTTLVEKVMKSMVAMTAQSSTNPAANTQDSVTLPLITLPEGFKGFHGHKGDSFREMVQMWRERGWVRVETSKTTPFVWWGKEGEILLYDRATWDWLDQDKPQYTTLLAGNPDPTPISKAHVWSFWPRHPKALEARVTEGLPAYKKRQNTLVFYGKIENEIQAEHRTNALHEACDDFAMPSVTNPHQYTQEEYLNKLAASKFGLCLAGFGPKCNREMECMALGTVPVVAPDVDMTNYKNPPQEGKHYIRLTSFDPQEAKATLAAITDAEWVNMSAAANAWWCANASCVGLFEVTKKLVEYLE